MSHDKHNLPILVGDTVYLTCMVKSIDSGSATGCNVTLEPLNAPEGEYVPAIVLNSRLTQRGNPPAVNAKREDPENVEPRAAAEPVAFDPPSRLAPTRQALMETLIKHGCTDCRVIKTTVEDLTPLIDTDQSRLSLVLTMLAAGWRPVDIKPAIGPLAGLITSRRIATVDEMKAVCQSAWDNKVDFLTALKAAGYSCK